MISKNTVNYYVKIMKTIIFRIDSEKKIPHTFTMIQRTVLFRYIDGLLYAMTVY